MPSIADEKNGFVSIFDGKTLNGWRSAHDTTYEPWSVKNGVTRGQTHLPSLL